MFRRVFIGDWSLKNDCQFVFKKKLPVFEKHPHLYRSSIHLDGADVEKKKCLEFGIWTYVCKRVDQTVMADEVNQNLKCGPSMMSWVDPYPFIIESIHTLRFVLIHTLFLRVWIDSIKGYGSSEDVIDGPHCIYGVLRQQDEWYSVFTSLSLAKSLAKSPVKAAIERNYKGSPNYY